MYGVTKVAPYPVAKADGSWVSYNSYLFELRHYMHYYETQQGVDFNSESGKQQLNNYKKQALDQVTNDAYVKQLADKNSVSVSDKAVSEQIDLMRAQNKLGTSHRELEEVLNEFWGWNIRDFRRSLKQQMLGQAVAAKLDTAATTKSNDALKRVQAGEDFNTVATAVSEGQQYGAPIDRKDANLSPRVLAKLFAMQPGEVSGIIDTGYSFEIVKVNSVAEGKVQASHIEVGYKPINTHTDPLKKANKPQEFISVR
jgi:parvulin-like peptidyl-prolyl isomerase